MGNRSAQAKHSSPGHRSGRDAEATKRRILDAAEAEFSRHGLKGARVDAIARGAGVTTAMIHYYFDNKEGLYKAVLQRPATEFRDIMASLNLPQRSSAEALRAFIRAAIAYEAKHPYRGMLWFQEAQQNQGEYFKLSTESWADTFSYLTGILERGMGDGSFRQFDPALETVHILGVCIFYFNIHENWKHLVPEVDRLGPEAVEKHTQAAIALILSGIEA